MITAGHRMADCISQRVEHPWPTLLCPASALHHAALTVDVHLLDQVHTRNVNGSRRVFCIFPYLPFVTLAKDPVILFPDIKLASQTVAPPPVPRCFYKGNNQK